MDSSDGNGADIGLVIVGGQMKVQVKGIGSMKVGNFNMGIRWQHLTIVVNTIGRGCIGAHPKVSDQTSELFELPAPPPKRCSWPLSGIIIRIVHVFEPPTWGRQYGIFQKK